jgi:hypothetical protein
MKKVMKSNLIYQWFAEFPNQPNQPNHIFLYI